MQRRRDSVSGLIADSGRRAPLSTACDHVHRRLVGPSGMPSEAVKRSRVGPDPVPVTVGRRGSAGQLGPDVRLGLRWAPPGSP